MDDPDLSSALTLTSQGESLTAPLSSAFSNGPVSAPPEAGFPFGGLLAALCAGAMRQGLAVRGPLRTLSVQYMAAARFGRSMTFTPRMLRNGRTTAFSSVEARQGDRITHHATAIWGEDAADAVALAPLRRAPPRLDSLNPDRTLSGPMQPRFARYVDYRFEDGPNILGGNEGGVAAERLWMRTNDGAPLDEARLCYLLDALYPPAWTAFKAPPMMTTVDLRYDILAAPTPRTAPDGWAFFEFRMLDLGLGWTVDEAVCVGADGTPLALSRQRRKLL